MKSNQVIFIKIVGLIEIYQNQSRSTKLAILNGSFRIRTLYVIDLRVGLSFSYCRTIPKPRLNFSDHYNLVSHNALESAMLPRPCIWGHFSYMTCLLQGDQFHSVLKKGSGHKVPCLLRPIPKLRQENDAAASSLLADGRRRTHWSKCVLNFWHWL